MNLIDKINEEVVNLTEKILYFDKGKQIERDYFVYWKIENRKSILNKGIILLVDNENTEDSFRKAFELKYEIKIPKVKLYDNLINNKIEKIRRCFDEKYY